MLDELVGLLVSGETVVSGLGDRDVRRDQPPTKPGDKGVEFLDQFHRVGTGFFGYCQRDCRCVEAAGDALFGRRRTTAHPDVGRRIFRAVVDFSNILEVHRAISVHTDDDVPDLVCVAKKRSDIDLDLLIHGNCGAGRKPPVDAPERLIGLQNRDVERCQTIAVEIDPHRTALAADDPYLGHSRVAGQLDLELVGPPPQLGRRGLLAPQGVRRYRHIVNRTRFDHRRHHSVRHLVHRRLDLRVYARHRNVGITADQKTDDDEPTRRL